MSTPNDWRNRPDLAVGRPISQNELGSLKPLESGGCSGDERRSPTYKTAFRDWKDSSGTVHVQFKYDPAFWSEAGVEFGELPPVGVN